MFIRTLCAFANDFENLGDCYLVIGQDCNTDGRPVFTPVGLQASQLDKIQRELIGALPVDPATMRSGLEVQGEMSLEQMMALLGLKDEKHFRVQYQQAAIASGLIEIPPLRPPAAANASG